VSLKWRPIGILVILLSVNYWSCYAQRPCNRDVNSADLAIKLPKEVCIPYGYKIFNVVDSVDLNNDDLKDVVVAWAKLPIEDGDTTFYSIYSQQKDSSFSLVRTYSNFQTLLSDKKKQFKS